MSDQWLEKAKDILASNIYMCLATCDGSQPWITPVYFSFDENLTFYFVSAPDTDHVRYSRPHGVLHSAMQKQGFSTVAHLDLGGVVTKEWQLDDQMLVQMGLQIAYHQDVISEERPEYRCVQKKAFPEESRPGATCGSNPLAQAGEPLFCERRGAHVCLR
jgi:hypothetical protein